MLAHTHTCKQEATRIPQNQQNLHTHANLIKYQYASKNIAHQFVDGVARLKWRQNLSDAYELSQIHRRDQSTVSNARYVCIDT